MSIHKDMQAYMKMHENIVNAVSLATMGAFGALLHSEYLRCMRQRQTPTRKVLVPETDMISDWFAGDRYKEWIVDEYIDELLNDPSIRKVQPAQPIIDRLTENSEMLKLIFELKIVPFIEPNLINRFQSQFQLNDHNSLYQESPDLDIFNHDHSFLEEQQEFLVHQAALQLISIICDCNREYPEDNSKIHLTDQEILIIRNTNSFALLCFDTQIIQTPICNTLSFVSSTEFLDISTGENAAQKNDEIVHWRVQTSPFNEVGVIRPVV